jgi:hypothetical protein
VIRLPAETPNRRWRDAIGGGVVLMLALASPACDDHIIGQGVPIGTSCLRDPPLSYENFGKGILKRHCVPCHSVYAREGQRAGAPPGVNFDSWDDTLVWADRIVAFAVDSELMPPAGGMVTSERSELAEWMRCEVLPALGEVDLEGTDPAVEAP